MACNCDPCNKCSAANASKHTNCSTLNIGLCNPLAHSYCSCYYNPTRLNIEDDFEYLYLYKILIRLQCVYVRVSLCVYVELDITNTLGYNLSYPKLQC